MANKLRTMRYLVLGGMLLQFGGCIDFSIRNIVDNLVWYGVWEFVLDNDSVFDLLTD